VTICCIWGCYWPCGGGKRRRWGDFECRHIGARPVDSMTDHGCTRNCCQRSASGPRLELGRTDTRTSSPCCTSASGRGEAGRGHGPSLGVRRDALSKFFVTGDRFYRLFHAVFPKPPLKSGPRNKNRCMGLTNFLGILKTGFFGLGFASAKKLRF
jgi:hypothetical protein